MAQTADTFRKNAIDSRLIDADEIDRALADIPPNQFPEDGEKFARELVKRKLLTSYQAQEIYYGRIKHLVLGNYVVMEKIGQGGMGLVLKAKHKLMKRLAAIKILPLAAAKDADAIARFQREFFAAGQLQHPNIVTAYDADESRGVRFLAMEYVDGKDLYSYVRATGPMEVSLAARSILQTARGLEYAHRRGVIHRDVKPQNLLIDGEGNIKILDMGLARFQSLAGAPSTELTSSGAIMGTVDYMAPEQAMNTKDADERSDIYSLGATLWFLLTGRTLYSGDSMMGRLLAHRDDPIPSLASACPAAPPALVAIYEKMVAKSPTDRFSSMNAVIAAIEAIHDERKGQKVGETENSLYRDPKLLAFFENLEAEQGAKLLASPAPGKSPADEATVAIAGIQVETRTLPLAQLKSNTKTTARAISRTPRILAVLLIGALFGAGAIAVGAIWFAPRLFEAREGSKAYDKTGTPSNSDAKPNTEVVEKNEGPKREQPKPEVEPPSATPPPATPKPSTEPKPPQSPATPAVSSPSSIDLLALLAPEKGFPLPAAWRLEKGELLSSATTTVENIKIAPISHFHYRVDCEMTLVSQGDALYIALPLGDAHLGWSLNAFTKPNVDRCRRGFASIGGKDPRDSPASREVPRLVVGARHRVALEIAVIGDDVQLKERFDDETPIEWRGNKSALSFPASFVWPETHLLGCGVVNSNYRVHKFIYTPITD